MVMSYFYLNPCYAKSNISVGKSEIYDPVWTIDSDFWNFSSNKTLSTKGIIDAAYSPTLKQWVCLLSAGDTLVSNDLKHWKRYNIGNRYDMMSIIWTDDKYIASGEMLLYSMDGIRWYDANIEISNHDSTHYGRGTEYEIIDRVYWNGSQYLAYGFTSFEALLYISNDGINWRLLESEKENYTIGWDFCWNGYYWLAVGNDKATICSYDSKWMELNIASLTLPNKSQELELVDCVWTGENFYAIDVSGAIFISIDGKKWEVNKIIDDGHNSFKDIIWTGKMLLAYEENNIAYEYIPGDRWKKVKLPFSVQCIKQEGNKLYAFSDNPHSSTSFVAYSTDGQNWKSIDTSLSFEGVKNIEYANGNFYIQSDNGFKVYVSKDGLKLKEVKDLNSINDIAANNKMWLATSYGSLYQSSDGVNFGYNNIHFEYYLNSIATFTGGWCVVGDNGAIFISKNGKEFIKVKSPTKNNLTSLYSDGKLLIAGGENSTIIISKDSGVTWSLAYSNHKKMNIAEIAKGNGIYFASLNVNNYSDYNDELNTCLMSNDGVIWKEIRIPHYTEKVYFFKGYFVAVGQSNCISALSSDSVYWISKDGEHWVNHYLEDSKENIVEVVVGNDLMMLRNSYGEMFTTDYSGQNVQDNLTVKGTVILPVGMVANKDGIELTMTADVSYVNIPGRTCGETILKIKPGENSIDFTMPIKLSNAERNPLNKENNNVDIEISALVNNSMGLGTEFSFPLLKDITLSDNTYSIELLPNIYIFHNKELEVNFRDLMIKPSGSIMSNKLQSIFVIVLKNFNSDMVEDLNHMTNLRQIIVPDEYSQVLATYFPNLDIKSYSYCEEMYRYYIDYIMYGYSIVW